MPAKSSSTRSQWFVPAALILLVAVPLLAGSIRLIELFSGAEITPKNERFFESPIPVVLHIICAILYSVLGAFQFVPGIRRRKPGWHRVAGRIALPCGLIVASSGLWMTLFYPLPEADGELLGIFRIVVSTGMVVALVLGFDAIRRRDIARHRAWMIRAYAIAVGAGTQVLTIIPWVVLVGEPGEFARAMLMGAAWAINIGFAEWIIRRQSTNSRRGGTSRMGTPSKVNVS